MAVATTRSLSKPIARDDVYAGGSGYDTLDLSMLGAGTVVDLVKGEIESSEAGQDKISSFEVVIGGSGDDTFVLPPERVRP